MALDVASGRGCQRVAGFAPEFGRAPLARPSAEIGGRVHDRARENFRRDRSRTLHREGAVFLFTPAHTQGARIELTDPLNISVVGAIVKRSN